MATRGPLGAEAPGDRGMVVALSLPVWRGGSAQMKTYALVIAALLTLCAGCESLGTGPSESSRYARLPTGLTLLDTDTGRCDGTVQVREEQRGRPDEDVVLKPGENATFEIRNDGDEDEIEWSCIGGERSVNQRIDCPD